jgi:hypothetical protein
VGNNLYLNVDSSLNFLTNIDASGGGTLDVGTQSSILNLGSIDTSVNIAGNPYVYTPFSLGSIFSPQTLNITSSSSSTQITFNWTIPSLNNSISSSFQNINATLYANISGTIKTYQILSNISSNISSLNTIIVTNQSSNNGFLNNSTTTYTYYSSDFSNMSQDASNNNQLILWYSNLSPYPNVSYAGYTAFQSIGFPSPVSISAPSNNQATVDNNFNVTDGSVTLQCLVTYVNNLDQSAPAPPNIIQYQSPSGYYITSGSSSRYPTPYSVQQTTQSVTCNTAEYVNTPFTFNNMYPDSSYYFSIQAKNASNTSPGPFNDPSFNYSTPAPSYPSGTFSVPNPLFNSSGKKYTNPNNTTYRLVSNNSSITNDIINYNNISSGFISNNIITAVQSSGTYGNNSLNSSLNVIASLNTTSTSISVKSFGFGPTFTNNFEGITVKSTTFDAYYKGNPYNQGFYLDCSTNMTISSTYAFGIPTSTLFYATLTENGNGINPSSSYSFYIDNLNAIPTYNSINYFAINSSSNYYSNQISGIWVLNQSQTPVFMINSLQLNNMGDYFYANPLVTYTFGGGVSGSPQETNNGNITNTTNGQFANPINITNNSLQASSVSSSYSTSISLSITFNNLYGQGSSNSIPNINVICDQPSYNLITNLLSSSIQNLGSSTSGYKGYRVWSANVDSGIPNGGTMNPSGLAPYPYIVNGFSIPNGTATGSTPSTSTQGYVNVQYFNGWDISNNTVTNQEILIANGTFTTSSTKYLNYGSVSSANGNTFNYSGLASTGNNGLKFATFAWNINNTNLSNLNFTLNLTSQIFYQSTSFTWFFDNIFTKPLYLFYRLEYTNNVSTWGNDNQGNAYPNTTWISVITPTSNTGNSPTNVCNIANIQNIYYLAATTTSTSPASGPVTFTATRPAVDVNNYPATLYLRIGIPDGYDGFSNITCYLS